MDPGLFSESPRSCDDPSATLCNSVDTIIRRAIDNVVLSLLFQGLQGQVTPRQAARQRFLTVLAMEEALDNFTNPSAIHPSNAQILVLLKQLYPTMDVLGMLAGPAAAGTV